MKKFLLPTLLVFVSLFLFFSTTDAQESDCRKIFDQDLKKCTTDSNACQNACSEKTKKPDGTIYFNSGEIYTKCIKESQCDEERSACSDQALADLRACGNSGKQPKTAEAQKETPKQGGLPVFINEWFSQFSQIVAGLIAIPETFFFEYRAASALDLTRDDSERTPIITTKDEQKSWEEFLPIYIPGEENITVVKGQGEIKSPASPQFIPIGPKGGDTVQVTYLDSTMRATSDAVQLRYTWSADSGAVINVPKWSEIKFREPMEVEGFTSHTVELEQGEIEIKVRNNEPAENQFGVDAGWLGVTVSRTHFWISQSQDKKSAIIAVYEGEVEVKTKDGKMVKIKPDGDKPGVVIVSKKLSPVKLALVGLVLVGIVGSAIFFLKRNKKRK